MGEERRDKKAKPGPEASRSTAKPELEQGESVLKLPADLASRSITGLQGETTAQGLRRAAVVEMQLRYGNVYSRRVIDKLGLERQVPSRGSETVVQRASSRKLDKKALAIVAVANDASKTIEERAVKVVQAIIDTYYPSAAELVRRIKHDAKERTISVDVFTSKNAKGVIKVGDYFVNHTTKKGLARRVLQVDHELEHIRQHRRGLGGKKTKALREFLAFHRESVAPELPGTGRVSHSTRVALIDGALKEYYRMGKGDRKKHKGKRDELLEARKKHASKSGRKHGPPPGP